MTNNTKIKLAITAVAFALTMLVCVMVVQVKMDAVGKTILCLLTGMLGGAVMLPIIVSIWEK